MSPAVVSTRSGSIYHLLGPLSMVKMAEDAEEDCLPVPKDIAKKFCYGFPRNWHTLVLAVIGMAE